jgi:thymidylate synthase
MREGYVTLCDAILSEGDRVVVRDMLTKEITGVTIIVEDSTQPMLPVMIGRGVNVRLAAVEALSMISGTWYPELIRAVAPSYGDVLVAKDDMSSIEVAYGPRIRDQLPQIVELLRRDPTSRQALLSIWRGDDLTRRGDKPCTIVLQFLLRDGLECHVFMRSQDVWLGLGLDAFVFTQVQHTIANQLDVPSGRFVHHVGSFHAYERNWIKMHELKVLPYADNLPLGVYTVPEHDHLPYSTFVDVARDLLWCSSKSFPNIREPIMRENPWYASHLSDIVVQSVNLQA